MVEGARFENEAEARAAFELGKLNFRCSVCGRVHRSGSNASFKCFERMKKQFSVYDPFLRVSDLSGGEMPSDSDIWRYWGRERELAEYQMLRDCIWSLLNSEFEDKTRRFEYHMLALPSGWAEDMNKRELLRIYRKFEKAMNGSFKRFFNRFLEVARIFEEARAPNLPFPFAADFVNRRLSFDGEHFISFGDFFGPRIEQAVQSINDSDLRKRADGSWILMHMSFLQDRWSAAQAGYFLPGGAYLVTTHGGIFDTVKSLYRYQAYFVFYLNGYERSQLVEVFLGDYPSTEELISRLTERAKAA